MRINVFSIMLFLSMLLTSTVIAQHPEPKTTYQLIMEDSKQVIADHAAKHATLVDAQIKSGYFNGNSNGDYYKVSTPTVQQQVVIQVNVQSNQRYVTDYAFSKPLQSLMPKLHTFIDYSTIAGPLYCNTPNTINVIRTSDFNDYRNIYGVRMYIPPGN